MALPRHGPCTTSACPRTSATDKSRKDLSGSDNARPDSTVDLEVEPAYGAAPVRRNMSVSPTIRDQDSVETELSRYVLAPAVRLCATAVDASEPPVCVTQHAIRTAKSVALVDLATSRSFWMIHTSPKPVPLGPLFAAAESDGAEP